MGLLNRYIYVLNEELEEYFIEDTLTQEQVLLDKTQDYLQKKGYECRHVSTYTEQEEYKWLLNQYKYVVVHKDAPSLVRIEVKVEVDSFTPISLLFHWASIKEPDEGVLGMGNSSHEAWESCTKTLEFFEEMV